MSTHIAELCTLLVEDFLGELAGTVFRALAELGRLPIDLLAHRTQLDRKQVKHALAVLIQQNLVFWEHASDTGEPHFEASLERAYSLVQCGKYLHVVEAKYGQAAGKLLEEVMTQGSARVCDLKEDWLREVQRREHLPPQNGLPNGDEAARHLKSHPEGHRKGKGILSKGHKRIPANEAHADATVSEFHKALDKLRLDKLLLPYHPSFRRSPADNQGLAKLIVRQRPEYINGIKGLEQRRDFETDVEQLLLSWFAGETVEDEDDEEVDAPSTTRIGLKRKARTSEPPARLFKKARNDALNGASKNVYDESVAMEECPPRPASPNSLHHDTTLLIINYSRLDLLLRDAMLENQVEKYIGSVTAKIYAEVLQMASFSELSCRPLLIKDTTFAERTDDENLKDATIITTDSIVRRLERLEDLENGMANVTDTAVLSSKPSHFARPLTSHDSMIPRLPPGSSAHLTTASSTRIEEDSEPEESAMEDMEDLKMQRPLNGHHLPVKPSSALKRSNIIRKHLLLLCAHRLPFLLHRQGSSAFSEAWVVPYAALIRTLRLDGICNTIHARFDTLVVPTALQPPPLESSSKDEEEDTAERRRERAGHVPGPDTVGLRIARILAEGGKLDEKTLTARSLVPPKMVRARCSALHTAGLLELQDVPRDAQRQAARTMFLWFLDPPRAAARLVETAAADMARLIKRRHRERQLRRSVLEKAARSDVRGHEHELLSAPEQEMLRKWRDLESRIWGAVGRLADTVALLRDF